MKKTLFTTAIFVATLTTIFTGEIGIVDFGRIMEKSKYGQKEQQEFESIQNQMQKGMQDLSKQLSETAAKLEDQEVLDALSPEAEKELQIKFQALNEDLNRYQNQFYQVMQQANMRVVQSMSSRVKEASQAVSKKSKCSLIINKEAVFHMDNSHDVTDSVISELDLLFAKEESTKALSQTQQK